MSSTLYICFCLLCAVKHVVQSCESANKSQNCVLHLQCAGWSTARGLPQKDAQSQEETLKTMTAGLNSLFILVMTDWLVQKMSRTVDVSHFAAPLKGGWGIKVNKSSERNKQTGDVTKRSGADVRLQSRRRIFNSESVPTITGCVTSVLPCWCLSGTAATNNKKSHSIGKHVQTQKAKGTAGLQLNRQGRTPCMQWNCYSCYAEQTLKGLGGSRQQLSYKCLSPAKHSKCNVSH